MVYRLCGGINLDQKYDNSFENDRYGEIRIVSKEGGRSLTNLHSCWVWDFAAKENRNEEILLTKTKSKPKKPRRQQISRQWPRISGWQYYGKLCFCAINTVGRVIDRPPLFMPNTAILTAWPQTARSGWS